MKTLSRLTVLLMLLLASLCAFGQSTGGMLNQNQPINSATCTPQTCWVGNNTDSTGTTRTVYNLVINGSCTGAGCGSQNSGTPLVVPSTLSFPATNVGQSSPPQQIGVTNAGTVSLVFSGISFANGTNFSQTNNCSTLAPAGTCHINVTFSPTTTGNPLTDTLNINDSAVGSPQSVSVSGIGQTAGGTPTPSSIAVTPAGATINTGASQQFSVVLTMSDSTKQNLAGLSFCNSSSPGVASIGQLSCLATGVAAGSTTIAALPTVRQSTRGSSTGSVSTLTSNAFSGQVLAGDTFACAIKTQEASVSITSVVDTNGDGSGGVFTDVSGAHIASGIQQWIRFAQPVMGAAANSETVTVTFSAPAQSPTIECGDMPGLAGGVDVAANASGNSNNLSAPLTTTNATDFIFGSAETQAGSGASAALAQSTNCATSLGVSLNCAFANPSTVGNWYAVGLTSQQIVNAWTSVTDSNGDTFLPAAAILQCNVAPNPGESQWYLAPVGKTPINTITIHSGTNMATQAVALEISGLAASSVLDIAKSQCAPSSTPTMTTGSGTTTVTDFGAGLFFDYGANANFTAISPYTFLFGITNFVTGSEYDTSVSSGSNAITMTDTITNQYWGAYGIFLKVSGSVNPLITGATGGALNLIPSDLGTNSAITQMPTFATGAYSPGVTLSPAGNAIMSSVAFEAVSGSTGLTVQSGGSTLYSATNTPPASWYPWPSTPSQIPGTGPLYSTPIPSGYLTMPLAYSFGNGTPTSSLTVGDASSKGMVNGDVNGTAGCNPLGPNTSAGGCGLFIMVGGTSGANENNAIYYSQPSDPYYAAGPNQCSYDGTPLNVVFPCTNDATFPGSSGDQAMDCVDQQQQLIVELYAGGKGPGFSLGKCSGTINHPCNIPNISSCSAERIGIDPSFNNFQHWTDGAYTIGYSTTNISLAPLATTTRFVELEGGAGGIHHALSTFAPCTNTLYKTAFPSDGITDWPCSAQNPSEAIYGGLYWLDLTPTQIASIPSVTTLQLAYFNAWHTYGNYVQGTGSPSQAGYGFQALFCADCGESLTMYQTLGVPWANSPGPAINAMGGFFNTSTGYTTGGATEGWLVSSQIPKFVTTSSASVDSSGNACGSGSGCNFDGHVHLLDQCVAKTMAGQPGC
jgi:hypothetical protein